MTDKPSADPLELLQISKEMLAAQQRFLPSTHVYAQVAEAVSAVTQANIAYGQALMRANAILLAAIWQRPLGAEPPASPPANSPAHPPEGGAS